jgi:hypothetical protein
MNCSNKSKHTIIAPSSSRITKKESPPPEFSTATSTTAERTTTKTTGTRVSVTTTGATVTELTPIAKAPKCQ